MDANVKLVNNQIILKEIKMKLLSKGKEILCNININPAIAS